MGSMPELTMTEELDSILEKYTSKIPNHLRGAAFSAVNAKGETIYSRAMGSRSITEQVPLELDSTMWIGSITKLQTCIAALIAIDSGLFTLTTDARQHLPALASLPILTSFTPGPYPRTPITTPNTSPITVLSLLTHTSGLIYDYGSPALKEWSAHHSITDTTFSGTLAGYTKPLLRAPGTGWAYSPGMDWVGRLIEVTSGRSLEAFLREHLWQKLGMRDTTFRPDLHADMQARRMAMAHRDRATGGISAGVVPQEAEGAFAPDCCGGVGLYSTMEDCVKVLGALMRRDERVLKRELWDLLTVPQLSGEEEGWFMEVIRGVGQGHLGQTWDKGVEGTFGLGSSIIKGDFEGRRREGSCNWSGMPGTHCWLDRKTGVGGMLTTQILPPGDPMVTELLLEMEKCVYRHVQS
ncbi:beta-lactamase/transpeptidase-like protein [Corynespora cassiicola Philippines]|uniref:Beta-lactamase/transpeptidase-like protein n=1 Tax=Corynespora cassiicola Philippines TaxID=1448308 RepID=A0A2T2P6F3_CORCC|nr:beta-lactamase/transpeptidase-like protein [Corynespora cassiicola Philippines]